MGSSFIRSLTARNRVQHVLSCGAAHVARGCWEIAPGSRPRLLDSRRWEWSIESPAGPEWWSQLRTGLSEITGSEGGPCVVRLPGHLTLLKQWTLDSSASDDESDYPKQARGSLPGDPNLLEWDYRVIEDGPAPVRLRLAAGIRTQLEELVDTLRSAGWAPRLIVPSSLPAEWMSPIDPEAILNVGAASTLLYLTGQSRSDNVSRRLSLAGNTLNAALMARGAISFAEAEVLKREGQSPDLKPCVREWAERMKFEIRRTRLAHLGPAGAAPPRSLALTGGGSRTPGLTAALAESLGTVVGHLDVPGLLDLNSSLPAGGEDQLVDLLPVCDRSGSEAPMNLLPQSERRRQQRRRRSRQLVLSLALLALAPIPLIGSEQLRLHRLNAEVDRLRDWVEPRREWNLALNESEMQSAARRRQIDFLKSVQNQRTAWIQTLAQMEERFSAIVPGWLTELEGSGSGPLELKLSGILRPEGTDERAAQSAIESLMQALRETAGAGEISDDTFELLPTGAVRFSCKVMVSMAVDR